jgi:uracil-DNA glycosylase
LLEDEFAQPYWADLMTFVDEERSRGPVYPPANQVFRALEITSCGRTKVVIVGQDPYPRPGQAHGLCFSVPPGVTPPGSLVNIHKELQSDLGFGRPDHGSLEPWAYQGVLLLNTILTVRGGRAGSHRRQGWERFTDAVIRVVTEESDPVFLLWGCEAQRKVKGITRISGSSDKIIRSSHPSPRSAHRPCGDSPPFTGSKPFSKANDILRASGKGSIDWNLSP